MGAPSSPASQTQIGNTWGDYAATLRTNADRWFAAGRRVYSVPELFGMEMDEAFGLPTGIITGRVRDQTSDEPVTNVSLSSWNDESGGFASGITDELGNFYLYGLGPGECAVEVEGYFIDSGASLEMLAGQDLLDVEISATEAAHLLGFVRTADGGVPVADTIVTVSNHAGDFSTATITDTSGHYQFSDLPADEYSVHCDPVGFLPQTIESVMAPSGSTKVIHLDLVAAGTISGRVVDASIGQGVVQAFIAAQGETTGHVALGQTDPMANTSWQNCHRTPTMSSFPTPSTSTSSPLASSWPPAPK